MALVKFGGGIVGMSGSIAGNTFARNRSGAYVRARVKPVNPNSALQQQVRNAMAQLTTRWGNTLTAVQRTAWGLYAASVQMKNRLGENINLSGFNQFIRSNIYLSRSAGAIVDAGPTLFELPEADGSISISASEATQLVSVTFDDSLGWANQDDSWLLAYMGTPQNPQRNFFDGPWRFMAAVAGLTAGPPTSPATMTAPFVITETQKIWVYFRILRADGRLSNPFQSTVEISA